MNVRTLQHGPRALLLVALLFTAAASGRHSRAAGGPHPGIQAAPQAYALIDLTAVAAAAGYEDAKAVAINEAGHVALLLQETSVQTIGVWSPGAGLQERGGLKDANQTLPTDINEQDEVCGWAMIPGVDGISPVLSKPGQSVARLGFLPGGNLAVAAGINNSGQVVGYGTAEGGPISAVRWEPGGAPGVLPLPPSDGPAFTSSEAYAINDAGVIAGWAEQFRKAVPDGHPDRIIHLAVRWPDPSTVQLLESHEEPARRVEAHRINASGQIAGTISGDTPLTAFFWEGGTLRDLGAVTESNYPSGLLQEVSLNDPGQVLLHRVDPVSGIRYPALWEAGVETDLRPLLPAGTGFTLTGASLHELNNQGQLVGEAVHVATGQFHAVLLTPGGATAGQIEVTPAPNPQTHQRTLDFNRVKRGRSKTLTVLVSNQGNGPLAAKVGSARAPYSVRNGGSFVLAAGASRTVRVTFRPTRRGTAPTRLLTVSSDDPDAADQHISIRLKGQGF